MKKTDTHWNFVLKCWFAFFHSPSSIHEKSSEIKLFNFKISPSIFFWVSCKYLGLLVTQFKRKYKNLSQFVILPHRMRSAVYISKLFWRNFINDGGFDWPMSHIMFWLIKFSNYNYSQTCSRQFSVKFHNILTKISNICIFDDYPISENILQFYRENVGCAEL